MSWESKVHRAKRRGRRFLMRLPSDGEWASIDAAVDRSNPAHIEAALLHLVHQRLVLVRGDLVKLTFQGQRYRTGLEARKGASS